MISTTSTAFIDKWHTLIGSALGPFLAIILSAIGYFLKIKYEENKTRKDHMRRIEISTTKSLNDTYIVREDIKKFQIRLKQLISEGKSIKDPKTFFVNKINFPPIREIYIDTEIQAMKTKSYYIHNKLLFMDAGTRDLNTITHSLQSDFGDLLKHNESVVTWMQSSPDPVNQRESYVASLESFSEALEMSISGIEQGIKIMIQIKTYNNYLRKLMGVYRLWKYEGLSFKYFKTYKDFKNYSRNLDSLDRIDEDIETEVGKAMSEAEKRKEKIL